MVGGLSDISISSWPWLGHKLNVGQQVMPARSKVSAKSLTIFNILFQNINMKIKPT